MDAQEKAAAVVALKAKAGDQGLHFFHDTYGEAWVTVPVGGHRETWRVDSRRLWLWIARALRAANMPATRTLIKSIVEEFELTALLDGPVLAVFVRVGESDGNIYLDLGNSDWQAVQIGPKGWNVLDEPPVKFRRSLGIADLPLPVKGGDLKEIFNFLNVRPQHEILFLTWMTFCYRPKGPFPILAISGVQGSGKSSTTKVLRSLIDPSIAALTGAPRDERSLLMSACNSRLLCFDNLSAITPQMSDAFCMIATGGAHRERKYYSNDGSEAMFVFQNPCVLNGISELSERPDLLDRSIVIHLDAIGEKDRRAEDSFNKELQMARPRMLGALLDAVAIGLAKLDSVEVPSTPRMADFCRWGFAIETHLGYEAGSFLEAYRSNLQDGNAAALEASPVAWSVHNFVTDRPDETFKGSAEELLRDLNAHCVLRSGSDGAKPLLLRHPRWPKSAAALSAELGRVEPNLQKIGVSILRSRTKAKRYIHLQTIAVAADDEVRFQKPVTSQSKQIKGNKRR
jgi:hypothetical protein